MIQPIILPAGTALLSERRRDSPSFAISIWFPFGSRNEALQMRGFVHFVEHMLFKGTNRHDAFSIWRRIEHTGGFANGFTERDAVCIYCCVPSRDWHLAAELIAEVAFSSTFPVEEFEKEKQVILSEILQIGDDIEETAFDAFLDRFWPDHPAARPIAGTCSEVEAIDRDRLFAFYRNVFTPSSAIVSASGDFDERHLAEILNEAILQSEMFSRALSGDRSGTLSPALGEWMTLVQPGTPSARTFRGYTKAPASQVYYFDAIQLDPPFDAKDFFSLCVVNGILGEASTSRLFQKVRERLGLAYTVQSSLSFSRTEALLIIQAVTGEGKISECLSAIEGETEKLFSSGLAEYELAEAMSRLAGSFLLSLEDPESRIRRLATWFMIIGMIPDIEEEKDMYLAVTMDDVTKLLKRLSGASRGRYAYGNIRPGTARFLSLKES
jgi:predicted Zn-dependent peptidase